MSLNRMLALKNCVVLVLSLQKRALATKANVVDNVLKEWTAKFEQAKIPEPENSIQNIMAHIFNTTKVRFILEGTVFLKCFDRGNFKKGGLVILN